MNRYLAPLFGRSRFASVGRFRLISLGSTIGLLFILPSSLTAEDFGRYALAVATIQFAAVAASLGLGRYVVAVVPKTDMKESNRVVREAAAGVVITATLSLLVSVVLIAFLVGRGFALLPALVGGCICLLLSNVHYWANLCRSFKSEIVADVTEGALGGTAGQGGAFLVVVFFGLLGIELDLVLALVAHLVPLIGCLATQFLALADRPVLGFDLGSLRTISGQLSTFGVIQIVSLAPTDLWVVNYVGSDSDLAAYALARRLAMVLTVALQVANMAITRELSSVLLSDTRRAQRLASQAAIFGGVLAVPAGILTALFALFVLPGHFGPAYSMVGAIFLVLSIGVFVNVLTGPCALVLQLGGGESVVAWTLLLSLAAIASCGALVGTYLGPVGLAWIAAGVTSTQFVFLACEAQRRTAVSCFLWSHLGLRAHGLAG